MTIKEKLSKAKIEPTEISNGNLTASFIDYVFTKSELNDLLRQIAKEQRNECAKEYYKQGYEYEKFDPSIQDYINNAPSPLD